MNWKCCFVFQISICKLICLNNLINTNVWFWIIPKFLSLINAITSCCVHLPSSKIKQYQFSPQHENYNRLLYQKNILYICKFMTNIYWLYQALLINHVRTILCVVYQLNKSLHLKHNTVTTIRASIKASIYWSSEIYIYSFCVLCYQLRNIKDIFNLSIHFYWQLYCYIVTTMKCT